MPKTTEKILELREKVKDLERDLQHQKKECEFLLKEKDFAHQKVRNDLETKHLQESVKAEEDLKMEVAELKGKVETHKAVAEEMEKRHAESAYKQLSDILKAITVKLPTLDIKTLSVENKESK